MASMAQGCGVVLIALQGHMASWAQGSEREEREGGGEDKRKGHLGFKVTCQFSMNPKAWAEACICWTDTTRSCELPAPALQPQKEPNV
jgi:hypothetical protein